MKKFLDSIKSSDLTITYALASKKHPYVEDLIKGAIEVLSDLKDNEKEYETLFNPVINLKGRKVAEVFMGKYYAFKDRYGDSFVDYVCTSNHHHKKKKAKLEQLMSPLFSDFTQTDLTEVLNLEEHLTARGLSAPKILKRKIKIDEKREEFKKLLEEIQSQLQKKGFDFRKEFPFLDSEMRK